MLHDWINQVSFLHTVHTMQENILNYWYKMVKKKPQLLIRIPLVKSNGQSWKYLLTVDYCLIIECFWFSWIFIVVSTCTVHHVMKYMKLFCINFYLSNMSLVRSFFFLFFFTKVCQKLTSPLVTVNHYRVWSLAIHELLINLL